MSIISGLVFRLLSGLMSHISRTLRWGLMIEPIGHKPRFINTFLAVMVGYLMNMAFPRMGELSALRCAHRGTKKYRLQNLLALW